MHSYELTGKKCYDHLGGKLGAALFDFLILHEWIELKEGTSTTYVITENGYKNFAKIGLPLTKTTFKQGERTV